MTPMSHRPYFTLPEASCVMPGPTMEDLTMALPICVDQEAVPMIVDALRMNADALIACLPTPGAVGSPESRAYVTQLGEANRRKRLALALEEEMGARFV